MYSISKFTPSGSVEELTMPECSAAPEANQFLCLVVGHHVKIAIDNVSVLHRGGDISQYVAIVECIVRIEKADDVAVEQAEAALADVYSPKSARAAATPVFSPPASVSFASYKKSPASRPTEICCASNSNSNLFDR